MKSYLLFNQIFTLVSHTLQFCEKEYTNSSTTCCTSIMKKTYIYSRNIYDYVFVFITNCTHEPALLRLSTEIRKNYLCIQFMAMKKKETHYVKKKNVLKNTANFQKMKREKMVLYYVKITRQNSMQSAQRSIVVHLDFFSLVYNTKLDTLT